MCMFLHMSVDRFSCDIAHLFMCTFNVAAILTINVQILKPLI